MEDLSRASTSRTGQSTVIFSPPHSHTYIHHPVMSAVWGSSYCWPLVGNSLCTDDDAGHHLGLADHANPPAEVADQAEKTDEEHEMERWAYFSEAGPSGSDHQSSGGSAKSCSEKTFRL